MTLTLYPQNSFDSILSFLLFIAYQHRCHACLVMLVFSMLPQLLTGSKTTVVQFKANQMLEKNQFEPWGLQYLEKPGSNRVRPQYSTDHISEIFYIKLRNLFSFSIQKNYIILKIQGAYFIAYLSLFWLLTPQL